MKIFILRCAGGEQGITAIGTADGRWLLVNVAASVAGQLGGAPPAPPQRGVHWRVVPVAGDQTVASCHLEGMPTLEFTAIATQAPQPAQAAHRRSPTIGDRRAWAPARLAEPGISLAYDGMEIEL
jgi:hypothetical protein